MWPLEVLSHPHIWVDVHIEAKFDSQKNVTSLIESWTFDEIFSATFIKMEDVNKNQKLDEEEIEAIKAKSFDVLAESDFYTRIFVDNEPQAFLEPIDFRAEIKNGQVIYQFELPLETPINPFEKVLDIGIYDEEYFIEYLYAKTPLKTDGVEEKDCPFLVFEDDSHPIYFDLVHPATLRVCRK